YQQTISFYSASIVSLTICLCSFRSKADRTLFLISTLLPSPSKLSSVSPPVTMFHLMLSQNLPRTMCLVLIMAYLSATVLVVAFPLPIDDSHVPQSETSITNSEVENLMIGYFDWKKKKWLPFPTAVDLARFPDASMVCCIPGLRCFGYKDGEIHEINIANTHHYYRKMKVFINEPLSRREKEKKHLENIYLSSVEALQSALDNQHIRMDRTISDAESTITAVCLLLQKEKIAKGYNEDQPTHKSLQEFSRVSSMRRGGGTEEKYYL
ncbi:hypothetical protein FB446DRAFT_823906, partial [Lentinula raphanica]